MSKCLIAIFAAVFIIPTGAFAEKWPPSDAVKRQNRFFPSWTEEQALRSQELADRLTDTIEMLPHVVSAKVHISVLPQVGLSSRSSQSSASVVILSDNPNAVSKEELKAIVAGASSGLAQTDVGVFIYKTKSKSRPPAETTSVTRKSSVSWWKPYAVGLIIVVMFSALAVTVVGVRRFTRRAR